jgi:hypothetical protein
MTAAQRNPFLYGSKVGYSIVPFHEEDPSFPHPTAAERIFRAHGYDHGVDAWLLHNNLDVVAIRAATEIKEVRGFWRQCAGFAFPFTFVPDTKGPNRAIAFPILLDTLFADVLFVDKSIHDAWGVLCGSTAFFNDEAIYTHKMGNGTGPLRIHRTPMSWLRRRCNGIIVLRSGVHGDLYFRKVGSFIADSLEHAEDLHERVFENSVPYAHTDEEAPLLWSEFEFRSAIGLGRVSVEQAERTLTDSLVERAATNLLREVVR